MPVLALVLCGVALRMRGPPPAAAAPALLLLAATVGPRPAAATDRAPPRVQVSLDDDPAHRWDGVVDRFRPQIGAAVALAEQRAGGAALAAVARLMGGGAELRRWFPGDMAAEVEGVAARVNMSAGLLAAMSLTYDFAASDLMCGRACTSIVAQTAGGGIVHGRNEDFSVALVPVLANVTVLVDYQRGGRTAYTAVNFLPMPVFNTVLRPGVFSFSQDERDQGSIASNVVDIFVRRRVATFALMRQVAEQADSFEGAVNMLTSTPLSAPSYFVLGGVRAGEGAVVTRGRDGGDADVWRLDAGSGRWYLLETNYDHWAAPPHDPAGAADDRRAPAQRFLNATGAGGVGAAAMWAAMSNTDARPADGERPTYNSETIFSIVMQAARPAELRVAVRDPPYAGPHPDAPGRPYAC